MCIWLANAARPGAFSDLLKLRRLRQNEEEGAAHDIAFAHIFYN